MLTVQVWDKGLVKAVEKSIREANLGLNPMADGQLLRIPMPPMTEERRKELLKKSKITEDDNRKRQTDIQNLTDEFIKKVDEAIAAKEKDILAV